MNERPILFSGPMVRAILDGKKTQTRRVVKDAAWNVANEFSDDGWPVFEDWENPSVETRVRCPYGVLGDQLWVRETFWQGNYNFTPDAVDPPTPEEPALFYRADGERRVAWRPSIHMPRWASRITLEITGVRVERLQNISEDDVVAEGLSPHKRERATEDGPMYLSAKQQFAYLWDSINAKRAPWDNNPWVWVVEFRKI